MTPRSVEHTCVNQALAYLDEMVAFDTVSARSNLAFQHWLAAQLDPLSPDIRYTWDDTGQKCNLFATIGPSEVSSGIILSGHSDVVPVDGQDWSSDPFKLSVRNDRAYGRGATDMKGFLACCLAVLARVETSELTAPIHFAVSYDEELACLGAPRMIDDIVAAGIEPKLCLVGEPTSMTLVTAHKGAHVFRTTFQGLAAHSSRPDLGCSAIVAAADFVSFLKEYFGELSLQTSDVAGLKPPVTTFNAGLIEGGVALNTVPERCSLVWEFRPIPETPAEEVIKDVQAFVSEHLVPDMQGSFPHASVSTDVLANVPALDPTGNRDAGLAFARSTGIKGNGAVAFGTEAGQFQEAGIPTVICGPGSIEQAHKPDEFVEIGQLAACCSMLECLVRQDHPS